MGEKRKRENTRPTIGLSWNGRKVENARMGQQTDLRCADTIFNFFFYFYFFIIFFYFSCNANKREAQVNDNVADAAKVHVSGSMNNREAMEKKRWANTFILSCRLRSIYVYDMHFSETKSAHRQ